MNDEEETEPEYCSTCDSQPCRCDHLYDLDREYREEVWGN